MFLNISSALQKHTSETVSARKCNLKLFMLQLVLLCCPSERARVCECLVPSSFAPAKRIRCLGLFLPSQRRLTRRVTCRFVTVVPVRTAPGRGAVTAVSC